MAAAAVTARHRRLAVRDTHWRSPRLDVAHAYSYALMEIPVVQRPLLRGDGARSMAATLWHTRSATGSGTQVALPLLKQRRYFFFATLVVHLGERAHVLAICAHHYHVRRHL